ncbi:RNA--NAD 2'-phosphotransferase [Vibrio azureus]|uniref:Probable RNA 2'-phosphotransferase n=1 Tax=Vibrio azureus NBRC 104587 TaxID=1219077 RepID=U3ALA7_9VIBR|nr:RNA 2'-phosphotransferase [Vibrio azureus]AUI87582.1 RNA--NAD 2'-phosphotransferase [Vibrio azureus]GAD74555.1 putative RNA 2'-phosphotransferase [Vibrio azureus NBRC 104587]
MTPKKIKNVSKFLSFVLRHKPDAIGLDLDQNGWANINELINKGNGSAEVSDLSYSLIQQVVASNDKKRFLISEDGLSIRANQGHSIKVDLQLKPTEPPEWLYHGTATRFLESIMATGLTSQARQHVHLSTNLDTARAVGQRYGEPVILTINAQQMHQRGLPFYLSENGVWLTEHVPTQYISNRPDVC